MDTVYILDARYKDNDDEILGAYDSLEALCVGFARSVAELLRSGGDMHPHIADTVARMMPSFLRVHGAKEDECRIGGTVYGWHTLAVETFDSMKRGMEV